VTYEPLTPYDWQQADIDRCVDSMSESVGALITSAPGAGKTLVGTEVAKGLGA
jgi:superfamily II DNA or RNA helicase